MNNNTDLPSHRFTAQTIPSEGIVEISDKVSKNTWTIPLSAYAPVTSMLSDLFPEGETAPQQEPTPPAAETEEAPKRRRGRPKKAQAEKKPAQKEVVSSAPDADQVQLKKRGRGRPKKEPAVKDLFANSDAETSPKKTTQAPKPAASKPADVSALEKEIDRDHFKLVLMEGQPLYEIIASSGKKIGFVDVSNLKKVVVTPASEDAFTESTHTSLMGAQARIFVLTKD